MLNKTLSFFLLLSSSHFPRTRESHSETRRSSSNRREPRRFPITGFPSPLPPFPSLSHFFFFQSRGTFASYYRRFPVSRLSGDGARITRSTKDSASGLVLQENGEKERWGKKGVESRARSFGARDLARLENEWHFNPRRPQDEGSDDAVERHRRSPL